MNPFLAKLDERIGYHKDNLALWKSGHLLPTEPDEEEVTATIRGLEAAIDALEKAKKDYLTVEVPFKKRAVEALTFSKLTITAVYAGRMPEPRELSMALSDINEVLNKEAASV